MTPKWLLARMALSFGLLAAQPPVPHTGAARWGPAGALLLHSNREGAPAYYLVPAPGAPPRRLDLPGTVRGIDWSPDGAWVAYARATGTTSDIFVARLDGSGERRLTIDAGRNVSPAWSPDGHRLAFMSDRAGSFDIWVADVASGRAERVTTMPGLEGNPRWSPDGLQLSLNSNVRGNWDAYVLTLHTGTVRLVAAGEADEFITDWLPGGGFLMDRNDGGIDRVAVADERGRVLRWLTDATRASVQPVLSRDGRLVAFTAYDGEATDVMVVSIDGGAARRALPAPHDQRDAGHRLSQ